MSITTICLDMDGVLVDAGDWHRDALNAALLESGYRPISRDEHQKEFDGLPTKEKLNRLVQRGRLKAVDINRVAVRKQELTSRALEEKAVFSPDLFCTLCGLKLMDYKIAVVSNSIRTTIQTVLEKLYIIELIDEIISNEDGKPKPAPDLYLKALAKLNSTPENTLVFEDGYYGERSAQAAGCNRIIKVKSPSEINPTNIFRILSDADHNFNSDGGPG